MSQNQQESNQETAAAFTGSDISESQKTILKLIGTMEALRRDVNGLATNPAFIDRVVNNPAFMELVAESIINNPKFVDRLSIALFSHADHHHDKGLDVVDYLFEVGEEDSPFSIYKTEPTESDPSGHYVIIKKDENGESSETPESEMHPQFASKLVEHFHAIKGVPGQIYPVKLTLVTREPIDETSRPADVAEG